jgi:hypothetical protein
LLTRPNGTILILKVLHQQSTDGSLGNCNIDFFNFCHQRV